MFNTPAFDWFCKHSLSMDIIKINFAQLVHTRRHIDHPCVRLRRTSRPQFGQQQVGEQKVAQIVDGQLRLKAVLGDRVRHGHNAGVVEQQMDARKLGLDYGGELPNGCHATGVEAFVVHFARNGAKVDGSLERFFGLLGVTDACNKDVMLINTSICTHKYVYITHYNRHLAFEQLFHNAQANAAISTGDHCQSTMLAD